MNCLLIGGEWDGCYYNIKPHPEPDDPDFEFDYVPEIDRMPITYRVYEKAYFDSICDMDFQSQIPTSFQTFIYERAFIIDRGNRIAVYTHNVTNVLKEYKRIKNEQL